MKGIKLSNYFQIIHPEYVYLKLTPNNSIENKSTDRIARSISTIFQGVSRHIKVAEDGIRDPLVTGVQTCALPIFHKEVTVKERTCQNNLKQFF